MLFRGKRLGSCWLWHGTNSHEISWLTFIIPGVFRLQMWTFKSHQISNNVLKVHLHARQDFHEYQRSFSNSAHTCSSEQVQSISEVHCFTELPLVFWWKNSYGHNRNLFKSFAEICASWWTMWAEQENSLQRTLQAFGYLLNCITYK